MLALVFVVGCHLLLSASLLVSGHLLLPVKSSLVPWMMKTQRSLGENVMFEHYIFLALVGFFLGLRKSPTLGANYVAVRPHVVSQLCSSLASRWAPIM